MIHADATDPRRAAEPTSPSYSPQREYPPDSDGSPVRPVEAVTLEDRGRLVVAGYVEVVEPRPHSVVIPIVDHRQWISDVNAQKIMRGDVVERLSTIAANVEELATAMRDLEEIPQRARLAQRPEPERLHTAAVLLDGLADQLDAQGTAYGDREARDARETALYLLQVWIDAHGEAYGPLALDPRRPPPPVISEDAPESPEGLEPLTYVERLRLNRAIVVAFALDLLFALGHDERARRLAASEAPYAPDVIRMELDWAVECGEIAKRPDGSMAWAGMPEAALPPSWRTRWSAKVARPTRM